jgi:hypothetical protein
MAHISTESLTPELFPIVDPRSQDDPIPKVFAYFCEQAGKSSHYRFTVKRHRMAAKRWAEEVAAERKVGTPQDQIRKVVGARFRAVIDEICACDFHRENGYLDWEQLFNSEERFTKWVDRYENGFSERKTLKR